MIIADTGFFFAMIELLENYAGLPMDMADASLVILAEHLGYGRILTSDRRDFNVYRWQKTSHLRGASQLCN
jgi:predicted nucleic acid-binding protein